MSSNEKRQNISLEAIEPFPRGAMVHFAHKLCNGLSKFFQDVRVVGSDEYELKTLQRNYDLIEGFHIPRDDMTSAPSGGLFAKLQRSLNRIGVLTRFCWQYQRATSQIIKRKPDYTLVATVFRYPLMGHYLGRMQKKGIRCLQICHEFQMREAKKKLSSRLLHLSNRNVYTKFYAIFFLSEAQRSAFTQAFPTIDQARLFVIRHGNSEIFGELQSSDPTEEVVARYGIDPERPTILFFGRIRRDKGVEDVVDALQLIKSDSKDNGESDHGAVQLVLAGHTPLGLQADLRDQINTAGLENDVVIFPEYVDGPDVWHLLKISTVAVFPYRSSSQSGALQTAMAAGKPVVVSNVGGIPEVIADEKSGLVIPPSDPAALKHALLRILNDADLAKRLGDAALHEAQTTYSWETVAKQMVDALETLES